MKEHLINPESAPQSIDFSPDSEPQEIFCTAPEAEQESEPQEKAEAGPEAAPGVNLEFAPEAEPQEKAEAEAATIPVEQARRIEEDAFLRGRNQNIVDYILGTKPANRTPGISDPRKEPIDPELAEILHFRRRVW